MRRCYPSYYSPPRRRYGGRGRSPPRRGYRGYGGRNEQNNGSLLVRNIPLDCRPEDLHALFERFGPVRDVYLPKGYYTGEPRGFAFVQFVDPHDASDAQYHMNRQIFCGREITVVVAAESRKRPEEMRNRARLRGLSGYDGRRSSYYGHSHSYSVSRLRPPHYSSRVRQQSRSYSPAPRCWNEHSASPRRRQSGHARSPRENPPQHDEVCNRRSESPGHIGANHNHADNGFDKRASYDAEEGSRSRPRPPRQAPGSPPGSRSGSADSLPGHSN